MEAVHSGHSHVSLHFMITCGGDHSEGTSFSHVSGNVHRVAVGGSCVSGLRIDRGYLENVEGHAFKPNRNRIETEQSRARK